MNDPLIRGVSKTHDGMATVLTVFGCEIKRDEFLSLLGQAAPARAYGEKKRHPNSACPIEPPDEDHLRVLFGDCGPHPVMRKDSMRGPQVASFGGGQAETSRQDGVCADHNGR